MACGVGADPCRRRANSGSLASAAMAGPDCEKSAAANFLVNDHIGITGVYNNQ
jgi:hypothetical protein